jgi:hypothetical protein
MCFSLAWLFSLLVWVVIVATVVAILWILIPWLLSALGGTDPTGGRVTQILRLIIGAIVLIAIIWFVYDLIMCFGGFPRIGPR